MNKRSLINYKHSNAHGKHKQSFPSENYNRTFYDKQYVSAFVVAHPSVFKGILKSECDSVSRSPLPHNWVQRQIFGTMIMKFRGSIK